MSNSLAARFLRRNPYTWRWILNGDRSFSQSFAGNGDSGAAGVETLTTLRQDGIIVSRAEEQLSSAGNRALDDVIRTTKLCVQDPEVQAILKQGRSHNEGKEFIHHLVSDEIASNSSLLQLAIDPRLLRTVSAYLGMRAYLREINLWLNLPTLSPATATQLWHQDDDDFLNLKVFVHIEPVNMDNGPFCFIPETHQLGRLHGAAAAAGRLDDLQMGKRVPENRWKCCTGPAGTMVLADTTGWHRGLKPRNHHRLLAMLQYTSGRPAYPRTFRLASLPQALTKDQEYALAGC